VEQEQVVARGQAQAQVVGQVQAQAAAQGQVQAAVASLTLRPRRPARGVAAVSPVRARPILAQH
jgi:hypothetical protein